MTHLKFNQVVVIAAIIILAVCFLQACDDDDDAAMANVQIKNDFNNPEMDYQPPWTICESAFMDAEFGQIDLGQKSVVEEVPAGIDYVLMVAAWDDPTCAPENCLPIASKNREEVVDGQTRVIRINLPNHQGSCPPEGVQPIPEAQYDRILSLWPEYHFLPYPRRTQNTQCLK